jgi:dTDP-4-amino-4,6-dideoxygalactose transaminase
VTDRDDGSHQDDVPLLDLRRQHGALRPALDDAVARVLDSQRFVFGTEVSEFESAVAAYCGARHAVGCASGSDALLLSLMALGVGPGDQVVCPSYTFIATAAAVARLGAEPVFADVDPASFELEPKSAGAAAASCDSLKAIVAVHLFGRSADTRELGNLADRLDVPLVHDAAQAMGARDGEGRTLGASGDLCCLSFYPSKNLGGFGDGGMVTTSDDALARRLRTLRNHGETEAGYRRYEEVGLNSRLDALQAAMLAVKLPHLDAFCEARAHNAALYDDRFSLAGAVDSRTPLEPVGGELPLRTPARPPLPARHVFNQYVVRVPAGRRDALREALTARGIGSAVYYPAPLHLQPCFGPPRFAPRLTQLTESERASRESLALPVFPELRESEIDRVAEAVIHFLRSEASA